MAEKHSTLVVEMARVVLAEIPQNIEVDAARFIASADLLVTRFDGATRAEYDAVIQLVEEHRGSMILDAIASGVHKARVG
ncbi:hypothetical protein NKH71_00220 [Mesorhizobium sp. M0983]|uniref:hypothetical protein n=1 Tax=Mesorhizobium sp. M0983 TaxID=2957040 RepID=UPI00333D5CD3